MDNPFPYEHECNPARLYEAMQQRKDIQLYWPIPVLWQIEHDVVLPPFYKVDNKPLHVMFKSRWTSFADQLQVINAELYFHGYRYHTVKDETHEIAEVHYSVSHPDWKRVTSKYNVVHL